ncbi:efflux RND transporter permease subunit [Methylohalobius crimeensis]|uniref:efflux RND transporter permease subunit n=1 Tax=Methylohalobius crimeensis TaxID=244365 RepID=UPI0003B6829C|nr:efflux RND transporter permease subunit [Methylohalobius crimeensis]
MLAALIETAIRLRGAMVGLCVVLCLYGGWRLSRAGLDIFPEFAPKQVVIQTEAPGLTAEQVERRVTQRIENTLGGLLGLTDLRSESIAGLSVITAVFEDATDLYRARQQVTERLASVAQTLPPGTGPPLPVPLSSSSATILTLGLTGDDLMVLRDFVDWTLAPRLRSVPGVADINVFGGGERQLQIRIDPERLIRYGLGFNTLLDGLRGSLQRHGSGFVETPNQRLNLNLALDREPLGGLRQLSLGRTDGSPLPLERIADIQWGTAPAVSAAQIGGERGLVLMVIGQYDANTLEVSRGVEEVLAEFQPLLEKQGITLYPRLFRPADYIERSIKSLGGHLLIGALFVVLVLYGFLFDWRSALISALAIPLSLLSAALILLETGVNLNIMVLGGLAIALGEVVDDAIIDTENIFRRLRENRRAARPRSPAQVVLEASLEVRGSVVYATLIVMLVFLPLLTLSGVAGRLFAPLGVAYILAILASLGVALTVTPALGYLLLGGVRHTDPPPPVRWLQYRYARLLAVIGNRPRLTFAGTVLVCLAALASLPGLGGRFLPDLREGHFIVHTASLPGTSLDASLHLGKRLIEAFSNIPGVVSVSQWAGRAERGADTYGSHYSEYEVHLEPLSGQAQQGVLEDLRDTLERFPGIAFEANTFLVERVDETLSGYTAPIAINLYGPDLTRLDRLAGRIADLIRDLPGACEVRLRSRTALPQLSLVPRPQDLSLWGLSPGDLGRVLKSAYQGRIVGEVYRGNRSFPISVILPPALRRSPAILASLPMQSLGGESCRTPVAHSSGSQPGKCTPKLIPLRHLAEIRQTEARYNLLHRNAQRVQVITAKVDGDLDSFLTRLKQKILTEIDFPPGFYPEFTGAAVAGNQARQTLLLHAFLAGAGVLLLIYVALGSWRHTLLTLINLPFALVGGVAAVWLQGGIVSVGSMVGFVTLFGITVRNAIMLIAHCRHLVLKEKLSWNTATAIRGAQERLPAVLMTALVTALAMLPIALDSDNPGREIMGPMAAIIIGGLVSSTALTLLLLPPLLVRWGRFKG